MTKRRQQGELENLVLDVLWASTEPQSSQQILEQIPGKAPLAITTVLTVLSRLEEKGLVARKQAGRVGLYKTTMSKDRYVANQLLAVLHDAQDSSGALAFFAKGLSAKAIRELKEQLK